MKSLVWAMHQQSAALHLPQAAGSLAFLSMIAVVPMFSIAFAVLTALPVFDRMRETVHNFLVGNLIPTAFSETLLAHLAQFSSRAGELSLVGAVIFFLTAFTTMLTVEATLNRIWRADRRRPLPVRLTLYWALLTLGPLVLATSLTINGMLMTQFLRGNEDIVSLWLRALPMVATFIGVMLLFRLVPSTYVRWREAACGAVLSTLLFELLRRVMGLYIATLPSYTVIYGAFAALPLFLLWLFLGWTALLSGALLAANLRWWRRPGETRVVRAIGDRFEDARRLLQRLAAESGPNLDVLMPATHARDVFDGDARLAAETASLLVSLGYLTRYVELTDVLEAQEIGGLRRLAFLRAIFGGARQPGQPREASSADTTDPVWAERWGWAATPLGLTLRPLFDAIWQAKGSDSSTIFPARFLDTPLVRPQPDADPESSDPERSDMHSIPVAVHALPQQEVLAASD